MKILTRYLISEYLKIFGLCLTALVGIYIVIDFLDKISRFIKYDPSATEIISYFLLRSPKVITDIAPMAVLIAVLLTLGMLSRYKEIIAMKNLGISSIRIGLPFFIIGLITSAILLLLNMSLVPLSKQRADYVDHFLIKNRSPDFFFRQSRIWLRSDKHTFMNIKLADSENSMLFGVNLFKLNDDFSLKELVEAERIQYEDSTWVLYNGSRKTFSSNGQFKTEYLNEVPIDLNRKPDELVRIERNTDKMTYRELSDYVALLKQEGYGSQRYAVDLANKIAMPFMSLVFCFIGVPMGMGTVLGHGLSRGMGLSLAVGTAYWIVYSLCISLGYAETLPAILSAWLPNILFTMVGLLLMTGLKH